MQVRFSKYFVVNEPITEDALLREYAQFIVDECGGNKKAAAKVLGVSRETVYQRLGMAVR